MERCELKGGGYGDSLAVPITPVRSLRKSKSLPRILRSSKGKAGRDYGPMAADSADTVPSLKSFRTATTPVSSPMASPTLGRKKEDIPAKPRKGLLGEFDWQLTKADDFWPKGVLAHTSHESPPIPRHSHKSSLGTIFHRRTPSKTRTNHARTPSEQLATDRAMYGLGMHPPDMPKSPKSPGIRDRSISTLQPPVVKIRREDVPPRPHTAAPSPESLKDRNKALVGDLSQLNSARYVNGVDGSVYKKSFGSEDLVPVQTTPSIKRLRSSRSGASESSSQIDNGSIEQSSIFTKMSSVSDTTLDFDFDLASKHASMTVDDAIELYSAGFDDDQEPRQNMPGRSSDSSEYRRRSQQIAQAMDDSIGDYPSGPSRESPSPTPRKLMPDAATQHAPSTISTSEHAPRPLSNPPPIQEPTSTHDQYGFRKITRDISLAAYDNWANPYMETQIRRNAKWALYMKDCNLPTQRPTRFPERCAKTQRFVRKGIPPAWRGRVWFFYAGGDAYMQKNPDLYSTLVAQSSTSALTQTDRESIERDVNRTFPNCIHFKPDPLPLNPQETPLLSSLRRVLCAFAIHNPRIGYCQSLNFITGLLLLFLPEDKAFWMLHIITTQYLPGTHELSLEGANIDLWVLMLALKESSPSVWPQLGGGVDIGAGTARLPPISLCTTSWFMSLFIDTLPIESVLRVWDVLFYEGSRTLFRVALAIFKAGEAEIRAVNDSMEIFQVVQQLPRRMLDAGAVVENAAKRGVAQGWVEKRRGERRAWYKEQRERSVGKAGSVGPEARGEIGSQGVEREAAEGSVVELDRKKTRRRANTVWKARLGRRVEDSSRA